MLQEIIDGFSAVGFTNCATITSLLLLATAFRAGWQYIYMCVWKGDINYYRHRGAQSNKFENNCNNRQDTHPDSGRPTLISVYISGKGYFSMVMQALVVHWECFT